MNIIKNVSLMALLGLGFNTACFADVAIIVNPKNDVTLDQSQIRNIYLGKVKVYDNGLTVFPIDIAPGDASRALFIKKILHKQEANLNSYWARMLFSSKGRPPEELENSAAVLKTVADNKSAIGYVDAKDVNDSVRVLFVIQ